MNERVYKICPQDLWRQAEAIGRFEGAPIDVADGYIHFSTGSQVRETARRHFAGIRDLLLITVDTAALAGELRYEPARNRELFPHLYGSLPLSAALAVDQLPLGPDGEHLFPAGIS